MATRFKSTDMAVYPPSGLNEMTRLMDRAKPIHEFFSVTTANTIKKSKEDYFEILL